VARQNAGKHTVLAAKLTLMQSPSDTLQRNLSRRPATLIIASASKGGPGQVPSLKEVFGISSSVPTYTYVDRQGLDGRFAYLLETDRHIVIYGSSKQGKTSLRRKQLPESECVVVPCRPDFTIESIYGEIRRQLGIKDVTEQRTMHTLEGTAKAEAKGKAGIPFITEAEAGGGLEGKFGRESESTHKPASNADSLVHLADVVKESGKRVVIEDFHYLSEDERRRLAFDMKALWDMSVFLIVIGVWAEHNLLTLYNNDLDGRVEEIDIQWSKDDLASVVEKGEEALNVRFSSALKDAFLEDASGSVGLLQRMLEEACLVSAVYGTQASLLEISDLTVANKARQKICTGQENRYHGFVEIVGKGFKDPERTKLKMYYHLVRVCIEATDEELLRGTDRQVILSRIQNYEADANLSVLSAALSRLNRLQAERRISPPVLVYNSIARKVALVDRELLFFRKYTESQWPWERPEYSEDMAQLEFEDPIAQP
jgi:hypothetical protein